MYENAPFEKSYVLWAYTLIPLWATAPPDQLSKIQGGGEWFFQNIVVSAWVIFPVIQ